MNLFSAQSHRIEGAITFGRDSSIRVNRLSLASGQKTPYEKLHYHLNSIQTFIVIQGEITIQMEHEKIVLNEQKILEIAPGEKYRLASHRGNTTFLVIGTVNEQGDRKE